MDILLVGCGVWGRNILRGLLSLGAEVQVLDQSADALSQADAMGACKVSDKLENIGQVDGVVVATPASHHAEMIRLLDRHDFHVPIYCEKPLASSLDHAKLLMERTASPLHVMHIWRYHPGIQKLLEIYRQGAIGELTQLRSVRANWTSPRGDVDCLANLAPHDLSIFQYILGEIPEPVFASADEIEGELVGCTAVLRSSQGIDCIVEISNRYGEKRREVRLHGTEGVLVLPDDTSGHIHLIKSGGFIVPDDIKMLDYEKVSALQNELRVWLAYLESGNDSELCSVADGAEVVFAIDRIRRLL